LCGYFSFYLIILKKSIKKRGRSGYLVEEGSGLGFVPAAGSIAITDCGRPRLVLHHCGHLLNRSVRGEEIAGRLLQHSPQILLSLLPSDGRRTLRAGNEIKPQSFDYGQFAFGGPRFLFPFLGANSF
jgi:hypothetical protein